ncbi:limonene-1,2-epoxide hydrolase [Ulvibacter sp. MAR_2010_11]|uniref:nuclear transport factor 2 family protein n=1 Tax=Ulvibacter sp. MAR_2010_11 TaxID=1250229 RepID=UPI000C2BAA45|nr:nuclear transport factor 2 family protein [Ulvibacter sp. MAR_2010_11]PKA84563.1 limonene-1,2-epoxide hydrolase [Ulvibacter sp. MAR_2010_11]
MNESEALIEAFYKAFANLDAEAMVACYNRDIIFEDPAFGILKGNHAGNMWRMLCESQKGKDFKVTYSNISPSAEGGFAHWEALYTFSKTGRKVHNRITAQFEIKDGKITRHTDRFNLYNWASQAFGIKGRLIGWTPFFQKKLQQQTNAMLSKFEAKNNLN